MYGSRSIVRLAGLARAFLSAVVFLSVTGTLLADDGGRRQLSEEQRTRLEERLATVRSRLELSEAQRAQLEPVLRESFERRGGILEQHGVTGESQERPSRREARALMRDLKAAREQTEAEVERILDDRQMEEYRRIQEEAQDEMRERYRRTDQRGSGPAE